MVSPKPSASRAPMPKADLMRPSSPSPASVTPVSYTHLYTYQKHNPVSYKPGGYMNGAGHGSTVLGPGGQYWHFASMSLSINVNWERRLCMFPAGFDKDGIMYVDTRFGDYPRYAPAVPGKAGQFRGCLLYTSYTLI